MMNSYGYGWNNMPEGSSKETLRADFMKKHILNKGSLMSGYATWLMISIMKVKKIDHNLVQTRTFLLTGGERNMVWVHIFLMISYLKVIPLLSSVYCHGG